MKQTLVTVGLFIVAAVIVIALWVQYSPPSVNLVTQPGSGSSDSSAQPVIEPVEIPANASLATVNYVHDGDTIFLNTPGNDNLKVRLLAVDTPEIGDNLECLGDEATAYTRGLLPEGSTVYTLADAEPLDQYGRSLLFVWASSGVLVNLSLVSSGYAEAVFIGGNRMLEAEVEAAEDAAQGAGLGIWGAC